MGNLIGFKILYGITAHQLLARFKQQQLCYIQPMEGLNLQSEEKRQNERLNLPLVMSILICLLKAS